MHPAHDPGDIVLGHQTAFLPGPTVGFIGINIGAGQGARAKRIAWAGTAIAASVSLAIGLAVAIFPAAWVGLFSSDASVLEAGSSYLRIVGPFYPFLATGARDSAAPLRRSC